MLRSESCAAFINNKNPQNFDFNLILSCVYFFFNSINRNKLLNFYLKEVTNDKMNVKLKIVTKEGGNQKIRDKFLSFFTLILNP